jgi:hypothetical protein
VGLGGSKQGRPTCFGTGKGQDLAPEGGERGERSPWGRDGVIPSLGGGVEANLGLYSGGVEALGLYCRGMKRLDWIERIRLNDLIY